MNDKNFKHKPLKKFGQNFLHDQNILNKIVNVISTKNKDVIEIGPGKGDLTKLLVMQAKSVNAFEIDNNLFQYLDETLVASHKNLTLHNVDFLQFDLNKLNLNSFVIIANIPYNITTDIIFKLFDSYKKIDEIVLLVQKEFANRMCAKINDKDYGKLTITTSLLYKANKMFDVSPKSFDPQPKVISSVIYLKRNENIAINEDEIKKFMYFVKNSFRMKRKTLVNNFKNMNIKIDFINNILDELNINQNARPENISFDNYVLLFEKVKNLL